MNSITIQPSRLPIAPAIAKEFEIQPAEWRVLVEQIFPSAKSVEAVTMALAYCRQRKLDIFKKPVHIVPMWSSAKNQMVETVWPGISEIRTTAFRTGEYAGIDEVAFGPVIEREFSGRIKSSGNWEGTTKTVRFPEWAKVTVYRMVHGQPRAYHATVYWEETYATVGKSEIPNDMWAKRPRGQLDKCVEAAALRKAFPEELGSVYVAEEMEGRVIEGESIAHASPPKPPAPPKQASEHPAENVNETIINAEVVEDGQEPSGQSETGEFDAGEFLNTIEARLEKCGSADEVNEAWDEFDVEATLTDDPDNLGIAISIRNGRLAEVK